MPSIDSDSKKDSYEIRKGTAWSYIIGLMAILVSSITGIIALNLRVENNAVQNRYQDQGLSEIQKDVDSFRTECQTNFRELRAKLDRIVEIQFEDHKSFNRENRKGQ